MVVRLAHRQVKVNTHLSRGCCIFDPSSQFVVHLKSVCKESETFTMKEGDYDHQMFFFACVHLFWGLAAYRGHLLYLFVDLLQKQ